MCMAVLVGQWLYKLCKLNPNRSKAKGAARTNPACCFHFWIWSRMESCKSRSCGEHQVFMCDFRLREGRLEKNGQEWLRRV